MLVGTDGYTKDFPKVRPAKHYWNDQKDETYIYLGESVFQKESDKSFWKYVPAAGETKEKLDPISAGKFKEEKVPVWYPGFVSWSERNPGFIPTFKVNSASIRNFEAAHPNVALIGVLYLPDLEIFLSPLVSRDDPNAKPSDTQKGEIIAGGKLVRPIQDTRSLSIGEKNARTKAAKEEAEEANEKFGKFADEIAAFHKIIASKLTSAKDYKARGEIVVKSMKAEPITVQGSSHNQLRAILTSDMTKCLGFTVIKKTIQSATFNDTSGTLNHAHFGKLSIEPNWKKKIMEGIANSLRAKLTLAKGVDESFNIPLNSEWDR